jgi:hypothetical protein
VRHRNLLESLERLRAVSNIIHGVKSVRAVNSHSANIADADEYILKDYESLLMLESLPLHLLRAHGSLAVFTVIAVHGLSIVAKASFEKPVETGCERSGASDPSRKTAGLITLRGSRVNAAEPTRQPFS